MSAPRLCLAVVVALLAAGCDDARTALAVAAGQPSAIVTFRGVTAQIPGVQDYVAVASARGNELRLVDPDQDRPILGPTLTFPLSIPTDPRPLRLAATSLSDPPDPADSTRQFADLLAVASPTTIDGPAVEIVVTWNASNRTLAPIVLLPGQAGEVLSLAAGPIPGRTGAARLVAGLATATGGQLAIIDVVRAADGGITPSAPVLKPLVAPAGPFDPADLELSPDGTRLFVATADPLASDGARTVFGVAQLAAVADPAADWPVTVLDARAPTRLVAAANVSERALADPNAFGAPALRVYAALEPSGCGETKAIRCGIVTLDPALGGLAPDPSRQLADLTPETAGQGMPYRAPISIPGVPQDISISLEPAVRVPGTPCSDPSAAPGARLFVAGANRCTTAVAAVPSTDGSVYVVDLGRFGIPNDRDLANPALQTRVATVTAAGLAVALDAGAVTAGFTDTDTWTVESQASLPGLLSRRGILANVGGVVHLAAQTGLGAGAVQVASLGSPELGVLADDLVELALDAGGSCTARVAGDPVAPGAVAELPGGALQLSTLTCTGLDPATLQPGQFVPATFTVRSTGLLFTSAALGYLGRPTTGTPFRLEWTSAVDPDVFPAPATHAQLVDQLAARKARRRFYPLESLAHGPAALFTVTEPGARGAKVTWTTDAGFTAMSRRPLTGANVPVAATPVDRSRFPRTVNQLETRYYVAYSSDQIFIFGPGEPACFFIR